MICLPSSGVIARGDSLITGTGLPRDIDKFIKAGDTISVFSPASAARYKIKSLEPAKNTGPVKNLFMKFSEFESFPVGSGLYESLFSNNRYLVAGDDTVEGWISIGKALDGSGFPVLDIMVEEGRHARFIYHNHQDHIFIESSLNWEEWSVLQEELQSLRREFDSQIKIPSSFNGTGEIKLIFRKLILDLFKNLGIPAGGSGYTLLDVYLHGGKAYLPLETLDHVLVRYFLPSAPAMPRNAEKPVSITIIYSDNIDDYGSEINALRNFLGNYFDFETIDSRSYRDYKYNIRENVLLHFTGHGKIEGGRGKIELGGVYTDRLQPAAKLHTAFLNCCSAGLETSGIVTNLLENGAEYVIASPYEITSAGFPAILDFYSFLGGTDSSVPFLLNSVKNPGFSLFYRLYGRYTNKI